MLQYREEQVNQMFTKSIARHARQGMSRLEAFFVALKEWFDSSGFRGCSFINASVELADVGHPASQFSVAHKERMHEMLREFIVEAAGDKAATVAPAVSLLVEGAIVTAVMEQSAKPADVARDAAIALVAKSSRKRK